MKKPLALGLSLALSLSLAAPALAAELPEGWTPADGARTGENAPLQVMPISAELPTPEVVDVPDVIPAAFSGALTVDGVAVDTSAIPGAPYGYIPMRALCDAMDTYVAWFPEDNASLFVVDGHSLLVNLSDLTFTCDFEPVADFKAYLDPSGYTFLPLAYLTTLENIKDVTDPALSSIHYDLVTIPERTEMETLAYTMMETANAGSLMELDAQIMEENFGFHMDAYDELVAYQPMISAQPTTIVMAQVKEGQMDTAKADFAAYHEAIGATLGFYPACAEAVANAKTVVSPNGKCLLFVCTWENNDDCVALFEAAYSARER